MDIQIGSFYVDRLCDDSNLLNIKSLLSAAQEEILPKRKTGAASKWTRRMNSTL